MCEYCAHSLRKLVKKHDPEDCAYRKALYCSICNEFGHSSRICPFHLQEHILERRTTEPESIPVEPPLKPVLWVVNDPQAIRAVLAAYDKEPDGTKNNPKIVEQIGKEIGRRVIFTDFKRPK